ncbi:MAG: hypothetical protein U1B30_02615, partial [Pseudomonadota bacterium]|nr:hypothetical protein [Pseudomonadota bacterium]
NLALLQRHQPKGGERKGKSDYQRQGEGGAEQENRPGDVSNSEEKTPQAGASQTATGQPNSSESEQQQALQQSLTQWRQHQDSNGETPVQIQQQLNTLKEDYQTMLKQRFATEDISDTSGLVVEKPW